MKLWPLSLPSLWSARPLATPAPPETPVPEIEALCRRAAVYLKPAEVEDLRRACEFGAKAHAGQRRLSGEAYIHHPLAVAGLLVDMHMDRDTVIASVLHDVLEDTPILKDDLQKSFGENVATLVDGVSKLTQMEFESYAEAQAENFRKMLLAMTNDIRVILVKLADRLHNMRTVFALAADKRRFIARETLDIYAPIAQRLGINSVRLELEDLGFAALYPKRHRVLSKAVQRARGHRKALVEQILRSIRRRLKQEGLSGIVTGREKHLYSIFKKMQAKKLPFSEVFDVYGFRIIADTPDGAYRTLGVVHQLFKPVPGKFKDYIAIPKANGYQSLHTVLFGPHGVPIEVQIRTEEMDAVAERGIAAHWQYKSGDRASNSAHSKARDWLKGILEIQREAGNSEEFLENVKMDLFPDEVYVFTPKGDIVKLPRGATAVDLAYMVHTEIGNRAVATRIDRRLAPLSTVIANGQTVEIITAPGAAPSPAWLNFVVTAKARSHIRSFLKNLKRDEACDLGRRLLNRELERFGMAFERVPARVIEAALADLHLKETDALLEEIGLGKRPAPIVARHLIPTGTGETPAVPSAIPLAIKGTEGMVVTFPKCCYPIPGDAILGYVSTGRGIVIHRRTCKNVAEFKNHPEKWVDVEWGSDVHTEFPVAIRLEAVNQRGALATIAAAVAKEDANIEYVGLSERTEGSAGLSLVVAVRDRRHLARVIRSVRTTKPVSRVVRIKG